MKVLHGGAACHWSNCPCHDKCDIHPLGRGPLRKAIVLHLRWWFGR